MLRSIRWTLQLWHAGLLALVLLVFGSAVFFEIRRSRYAQVDADLERSAQLIAAGIRPMRPPGRPPGPPGPPDFDRPPDRSADGPRDARRDGRRDGPPPGEMPLMRAPDLVLPAALADRFATSDGDAYYVTWDRDGAVLGRSDRAPDVPRPPRPAELTRDSDGRPGPPGPREPQPPQIRQRPGVREAVLFGPFGVDIVVGRSTEPDAHELRRLALLMTALGGTVLVVGLAGGLVLADRVIRPIKAITAAAESVNAANLSRRIDVHDSRSELGGLAAVLNNAFARLEAAFAQQSRFIADASHELRTPLAVMHSSLQLALSRERTAAEYRKTVLTCGRASTRMKDLIDSLLLLAGADAGRLTLDREPIALSEVVAGAVEMITPIAAAKGVTIESHLTHATVDGDATRIEQVVTNLLSNAVRYNHDGGRVTVTLRLHGDTAELGVADTGVGIPAEHRSHVFDRFYRVDAARSRAEGGSGLGLAIVWSIVTAHGGTIGVDSVVGEGTTFKVRLPARPASFTQASGDG